MPAGQNTDAFAKLLRRRADTMWTKPLGPDEPSTVALLNEAAHRLDQSRLLLELRRTAP